jgi:predicted acylesterase/phospholipase RssA
MTFDVVSGTSVGALNGALVAYDRLGEGEEYWRNLSPGRVVNPRYRWLPAALLVLLFAASDWWKDSQPAINARNVRIMSVFYLFMVAVVASSSYLDAETSTPDVTFWRRVLAGLAIYGALFLLWIAHRLLRRVGFSILEPRPIREFVRGIIGDGAPRLPLYVTLTRQAQAFDPDQPHLFYGKKNDRLVWGAVSHECNFPHYVHVSSLDPAERESALLASAALPLGVFPGVTFHGVSYVDGGVADNLPLEPLISREDCDELVIIAMRPWTEDDIRSHWQETERLTRLETMQEDKARRLYYEELNRRGADADHAPQYDPPVNLPLAEPTRWPSRTLVIAPDRRLGSFLTGTMRFTRRYANRLVEQGIADASRAIETTGFALG